MTRKILITLVLVVLAATAIARPPRAPRVKVEWGVLGGINVPSYTTNMDQYNIKDRLGWQVGITTAVNFGAFAIEPQILFVRQGLKIRPDGGDEIKLRTNSIDVPVLFSLRMLKPVRFFLGPVLTVMNDCKDKQGGDLIDFGRVRPTVSFTAGVGFVLNRNMLVDLRYNGQFRSKHHVVLPSGDEINKLRSYNIAFTFGYLF